MAKKKKQSKVFVLDTNVLLHDFRAIYKFEDNDIVIPITVLEELDKFKKGHDEINFHAREFTRELDKLAGDGLLSDGIPLGEGLGTLYVETNSIYSEKVKKAFSEQIPDHRILSVADGMMNKYSDRDVIMISKDINLRMKAKSLGIKSQDYENDKIRDVHTFERGLQVFENIDSELIAKMYKTIDGIPFDEFELQTTPLPHEYFILKGDRSSVISHYNPADKTINRVAKRNVFGIEPRNAEQTFALHALTNPDVSLVAITGKAGTGKTLLALAAALEQHDKFAQILLARPIVALANKDMGFLPGSEHDKIRPYMQPLFDNLNCIKQSHRYDSEEVEIIESMQEEGTLEISPLAYIRGRTLANVYFIVDEAQNLTPHEVKTIITRAGEGTKIIFTGDIQQIDSPYLDTMSNGLSHLTSKMKGQDIFSHINLVKGERSKLAELASNLL